MYHNVISGYTDTLPLTINHWLLKIDQLENSFKVIIFYYKELFLLICSSS